MIELLPPRAFRQQPPVRTQAPLCWAGPEPDRSGLFDRLRSQRLIPGYFQNNIVSGTDRQKRIP